MRKLAEKESVILVGKDRLLQLPPSSGNSAVMPFSGNAHTAAVHSPGGRAKASRASWKSCSWGVVPWRESYAAASLIERLR
ncbi:MAG: hypothetical protein RDV48_21850 [Candidatus Eremiobacteraeota bacterium]|nr:hypothetical protein [Candidatus Eremiobacteraeota bacterium]